MYSQTEQLDHCKGQLGSPQGFDEDGKNHPHRITKHGFLLVFSFDEGSTGFIK